MKKDLMIIIFIIAIICLVFFGPQYAILGKPRLKPNNNIPEKEMVYYYYDPPQYKYPVTFANNNGEEQEYRDFIFPIGLYFNSNPLKEHAHVTPFITWSNDGNHLGFIASNFPNPNHGYPVLVSTRNQFFSCLNVKDSPTTSYRFWIIDNTTILIIDSRDRVILYDMKVCRETETLYEAKNSETPVSVSLSSQGWLALIIDQGKRHIKIFSPDKTLQTEVELDADNIAWSKEGDWLAFIMWDDFESYLCKMKKDGSVIQTITEADDSPAWPVQALSPSLHYLL